MLTGLDRHVQHFQPEIMATAMVGVFSPSASALRMSSAGHPPPILARPDQDAAPVPLPADLPVGVELGHPRRTVDVPLPLGSVLCLYSDGLVERRKVLIDTNIEKLRRTVTPGDAEAVCADVMRRLIGFGTPEDDVALLVVRRLSDGRVLPTAPSLPAAAGF
jgi:serine phosphatase RsbU (regulator of sigma subunit)